MLTIRGNRHPFCDGISRREFLSVGALALGGLSLPQLLAAEARAGVRNSHKAVIMIYLPGGPSHQDMVDLKRDAPAEIRGEFKPIKTSVPGIEVCEHLPKLAAMMDKFAIIRSLTGTRDEHDSHICMSGYSVAETNQNHARIQHRLQALSRGKFHSYAHKFHVGMGKWRTNWLCHMLLP